MRLTQSAKQIGISSRRVRLRLFCGRPYARRDYAAIIDIARSEELRGSLIRRGLSVSVKYRQEVMGKKLESMLKKHIEKSMYGR